MGERRFAEQGEDLQERARWGSSAPEETDRAADEVGDDKVEEVGDVDEVPAPAQESAPVPEPPTAEPAVPAPVSAPEPAPAPVPVPVPQRVGSGFGAHDTGRFLPADASEKLRERWRGIQFDFVDDPQHAVEEADALLQQLATQVTESIDAGCRSLRGSWQKDGPGSAALDDGTPTEQLRTALREYRDLVNRLLSI